MPLTWLDAYAQNHVDFVEFGWPARDPYLDGADVRASMERASRGEYRGSLAQAKRSLAAISNRPRRSL